MRSESREALTERAQSREQRGRAESRDGELRGEIRELRDLRAKSEI